MDKIKEAAPDLKYVFDTIGGPTTSDTASKALGSGGSLCTVRPDKSNTDGVVEGTKVTAVLVWTAFLKKHRYGKLEWPVSHGRPCQPILVRYVFRCREVLTRARFEGEQGGPRVVRRVIQKAPWLAP